MTTWPIGQLPRTLETIDRLLIAPPAAPDLTGFARFGAEFLLFGIKEARACLFAGLFFVSIFLVPRGGLYGLPRYDLLLSSSRRTLTSAFRRAGWRTVAVLPSTRGSWPEGRAFYRFDQVYGRASLGYAGPTFGFSAMPDQFTLAALERLELTDPQRRPLMAEV